VVVLSHPWRACRVAFDVSRCVHAVLLLLSLLSLQCPLKVESEPTLKALAAANHMLMMITGGCLVMTSKRDCKTQGALLFIGSPGTVALSMVC
jgi:hypothetical protein